MKFLFLCLSLLMSINVFSSEVYHCKVTGPDYILTFHDDQVITLESPINGYVCQRGYENFPGTELELNILNCVSSLGRVKYYITQFSELEIILSRNFISTKDISCQKL